MMFASDYRHEAWKKLSGNWTTAVVSYLIVSVLMSVASYVLVGSLLFGGVLSIGMNIVLLGISRNGSSNFENLFDGFRNGLGNNIVASILVQVFTFLWSLLFIIPGIVKSYSYSMTYFILADNPDMAPTDAIKASREMMDGKKWRLFCLDLSFIGWYLLSILTLGILALWISPYNMMARAEFYESIKPQTAQDDTFVGGMAEGNDSAQI
jgi:uncharacterized membrane protein